MLLVVLGATTPAAADGPNTCQRQNVGGQFGVVIRYDQMLDPTQATLFADNGGIFLRTNLTVHSCGGSMLDGTDGIQVQGTDGPNHFTQELAGFRLDAGFAEIPTQIQLGGGMDTATFVGTPFGDHIDVGQVLGAQPPTIVISIATEPTT